MVSSIERFHCIQDSQLGHNEPSIDKFTVVCCSVLYGQLGCTDVQYVCTVATLDSLNQLSLNVMTLFSTCNNVA